VTSFLRQLSRSLRLNSLYSRFVARPPLSSFTADGRSWEPEGPFATLFAEHEGREAVKWVHFFAIYDELFGPYAAGFPSPDASIRPLRFLEIGVDRGGSLELWRKFFGPDAVIFGIDINPSALIPEREDLEVRIGSQDDPAFLAGVVAEMGGVDVVLDDGSHVATHQRASFDVLFPLLSEDGLYVIEDTHTAYWWRHEGGLRRPGTIVQVAKAMVDGLSKSFYRAPVSRRARLAAREVSSIRFYDSIIAIAKQTRRRPEVRQTGRPGAATPAGSADPGAPS
jgi:hypothetical protein